MPHYIVPVQVHPKAIDALMKKAEIKILSLTPIMQKDDNTIISSEIAIQLKDNLYLNVSVARSEMKFEDEVEHLQVIVERNVPNITDGNPKNILVFEKFLRIRGNVQCELLVEEEKYTDLSSKKVLYTSECGTGILLKNDEETVLITCNEFCTILVTKDQEIINDILNKRYNFARLKG